MLGFPFNPQAIHFWASDNGQPGKWKRHRPQVGSGEVKKGMQRMSTTMKARASELLRVVPGPVGTGGICFSRGRYVLSASTVLGNE